MAGTFNISRDIWRNVTFKSQPFTEREAYIWMTSEASWKSREVRVGNTYVNLERGQLADDVWEMMLVDKAVAVVTPWNKGRKLPKERDLDRLNNLTDKLYLTAPPEDKHRLKHNRFVEKVMRDFGVKTYVDADGIGHVRCRKQIDVDGDWVIEQISIPGDP